MLWNIGNQVIYKLYVFEAKAIQYKSNESLNKKNHYIHLVIAIERLQEYLVVKNMRETGITINTDNIKSNMSFPYEI